MSGYVATDSSTKEKPPNKYGIDDVVYAKDHGLRSKRKTVELNSGDKGRSNRRNLSIPLTTGNVGQRKPTTSRTTKEHIVGAGSTKRSLKGLTSILLQSFTEVVGYPDLSANFHYTHPNTDFRPVKGEQN